MAISAAPNKETEIQVPAESPSISLALLTLSGIDSEEFSINSATINPARFLHIDWKLGSVDPGKTADLVLVAANPLEDIRNLHLVRAVVLNGRFLDRGQLDGAVPRFQ